MVECNDCVKNEFHELQGGNKWATWALRGLVAVLIFSNGLSGWVVYAKSEKDAAQDSRIMAVETNQANIMAQLNQQNKKLDRLIEISSVINIQVQTHLARTEINRTE